MDLAEIVRALQGLPPAELTEVAKAADAYIAQVEGEPPLWLPNPGPQTEAYETEADETLFGGEPGGGKSQVGIGLALTRHLRALLLRRTNKEASKFVGEIEEILGSRDGYSGQRDEWSVGKRHIDIGGVQHEDDKQKYKGDPHDLIFFDELPDFSESQYMFITQWNRSTVKGQRCRIVASSNGPSEAGGLWVVERWAAWLDPLHPSPAASGEIRWYLVNDDGKEIEVDGPGPYQVLGRSVRATSRTFIRSRLTDNPDLADTNYGSRLMNQKGDNRKAYALGDFTVGLEDAPGQMIPSEWIKAAQERWQPVPPAGIPMCSMGIDVADGGKDNAVIARRHDGWFNRLLAKPGTEIKGGPALGGWALAQRQDGAVMVVDVGGGWGAEAYGHLRGNGLEPTEVIAYMGVKACNLRTSDNQIKFGNVRTAALWRFREALDPNQPGGSMIALPHDDRLLVQDLCAVRFEIRANGMWAESKEDVVKKLQRSPDRGDAVVMAWWAGARMATSWHQWPASKGNARHVPQVKLGRSPLTRR